MQLDFDVVIRMLAEAGGGAIVNGRENPFLPIRVGLTKSKRFDQPCGSFCILRPHQQIDVGHGPLTARIQTERVQGRSLQRHRSHSLLSRQPIDPKQQLVDSGVPAARMGSLLLEEIHPARGALPVQRARQQR